ncbi:MAG: TAT-variant-translocated molybdopterin oxidoreductase [Schleiferiaceae bacterium]
MASNKVYWKSFDQLANTEVSQRLAENEFAQDIPADVFLADERSMEAQTSRRDFLKFLGFSTAAATLAACEQPIIESVPYVVKPDSLTPGVPSFYATAYTDGQDYASVLVKTREGRPIKVEPGDAGRFNRGTNARAQASVLSLYDSARLRGPLLNGKDSDWATVESAFKKAADAALAQGSQFVLVTSSVFSPSLQAAIERLRQSYANFQHVEFDAISQSNTLDVWEALTGVRALPSVDLTAAKLVLSLGSDILSGATAQQLSSDYAARRKPGSDMLRHVEFESNLSLTGSNADKRVKIKPSEVAGALAFLVNELGGSAAKVALRGDLTKALKSVAGELKGSNGKAVVLVGGDDANVAKLAAALNALVGAYGTTVRTDKPVYIRRGNEARVANLLADLNAKRVGALLVAGTNPVYFRPDFEKAIKNAKFSMSLTDRMDETAVLCSAAAPLPHYLEAWADFRPVAGEYTVAQPTIKNLFNSKSVLEVLGALSGDARSAKDQVAAVATSFGLNWNQTVHDGGAAVTAGAAPAASAGAAAALAATAKVAKPASGMELAFYENAVGAGHQANNPWLHELPDPVTRLTWDNYLTIAAADALALGFENETNSDGSLDGSYATVKVGKRVLENVPVFIQPGQTAGTVGLAYGYGRTSAGKVADQMGVNAYALGVTTGAAVVEITKAEGMHEFATVQLGHTMMGRRIVNEVTLADFIADPSGSSWNEKPTFHTIDGHKTAEESNLWANHDHETMHMWNMSIDLNSCTGCGACVVACHIENNVPVVGKQEIRNLRDMHWLRIDRYYSSDMSKERAEAENIGGIEMYAKMEEPSESPAVVFQPVMCQHCNHAPCETVCPVGATVHSREGLNHMAYNRCIGTRYCANNCPYKVRRFNWFNYMANEQFADVNPAQDDYGRMVLNPDVTVRSRGVMEKCTMCIQRVQYAKLEAKKAGQPLADGAFTTACAEACDTGAITFGDVNNAKSAVRTAKADARAYHLLEEVGTQPSVFYLTKVRNA